ncbi:MAG: aminoacyl-tRNA hydrolase, partial [Pseudomonadota bacterium]
ATHRHNLGFWFIDQLACDLKVQLTPQAKFFGQLGRADSSNLVAGASPRPLWLLQPSTYMNHSGQAVAALAKFYQIEVAEILVVHDELDLPPGGIRLKQGGGNGGHNGLKDIQAQLGSADFWRLRLGIGHPGVRHEVINYVLKAPRREEQALIDTALNRCRIAWPLMARGDYAKAQQSLHIAATI